MDVDRRWILAASLLFITTTGCDLSAAGGAPGAGAPAANPGAGNAGGTSGAGAAGSHRGGGNAGGGGGGDNGGAPVSPLQVPLSIQTISGGSYTVEAIKSWIEQGIAQACHGTACVTVRVTGTGDLTCSVSPMWQTASSDPTGTGTGVVIQVPRNGTITITGASRDQQGCPLSHEWPPPTSSDSSPASGGPASPDVTSPPSVPPTAPSTDISPSTAGTP